MNLNTGRLKLGRLAWTVLVTFYFLVFFRNFMSDAAAGQMVWPMLFSYAFVLWLAVEYYFGSPFFQSGAVPASPVWRGVFAFFVYPFLGYVAADRFWWHWTQIPIPVFVIWVLGMALFLLGTYVRLDTLFAILRLESGRPGKGQSRAPAAERGFTANRFQARSRHPRYFATLMQLVGAALVFGSWGGLVLALVVGLVLILVQVRYEDRQLKRAMKAEFEGYADKVPLFWPRLSRQR